MNKEGEKRDIAVRLSTAMVAGNLNTVHPETDEKPIIKSMDAVIGYNGKPVVSGMNFEIKEGEIVALIGENGSGKSTLIKTMIKEIPLISGSIEADGRDIRKLSAQDIARFMAIVMTGNIRPDYFTCYDMIASGRYPYTDGLGRLKDKDRETIEEAMSLTGTEGLSDKYVTDISDGQRQLVMLARAIAQEPRLLILDEPTSFLDIRHKLLFSEAVKKLVNDRHISVLMSMHELDIVRDISDRVVALKDGKMDRIGGTSEVLSVTYIKELFRL